MAKKTKTTSTRSKVGPIVTKKKMARHGGNRISLDSKQINSERIEVVGKLRTFVPKNWEEVEANEQLVPVSSLSEECKLFPPPRRNPVFVKRWSEYVTDVVRRENFKVGHLAQLKILCDLFVEYDDLLEELKISGYTYESHGRNGTQVKEMPTVAMIARVRSSIITYSKVLGLLLVKDKELSSGFEPPKGDKSKDEVDDEKWD